MENRKTKLKLKTDVKIETDSKILQTTKKRTRQEKDFTGQTKKRKISKTDTKPSCSFNTNIKSENDVEQLVSDDEQLAESQKPCSSQTTIKSENDIKPSWSDYELLAEAQNLSEQVAKTTIRLFEEGNTIPFIARYRKDATGDLAPEQLRDIKDEFDKICALKARSQTVLKNIQKTGNLNALIKKAVLSARSVEELEHIYAPYKPGTKRSLAERAKALGLEKPALDILNGSQWVNAEQFVDTTNKELKTVDDVEKGLMHIIASVIATDTEVLSFLRKLRTEVNFLIETKKSTVKKASTASKANTGKPSGSGKQKAVDEMKFATYFDFKIPQKYIKPHQILAINRGEALKIISVKIDVPQFVFNKFSKFCATQWIYNGKFDNNRKRILEMSITDSYARLVQPYIIREIRSELKSKAEKASYEVFSTNLKQLLLMPPLKGRPILGIDPGFSNGCKLAVISETGSVLSTAVVYPHKNRTDKDINTIKSMLKNHSCSLIALGNGTACRETEAWLSELLQNNVFAPLEVTYTIVNESGASIYSCSPEAKKEFSTLDPNLISAVSLARRVQEPLAELVKVEPKHLGVGMYQHDLPKKQLEEALDEVVMECVSFVGVDLNTASQCLLRRIAGLTDKRATQIVEYREKKSSFVSRKELMDVKGIGARVFEQCAGFLRVGPTTSSQASEFYKNPATNRLDCTYIHPESYNIAKSIIKKLNLNIKDVGQQHFIDAVKLKIAQLDTSEVSVSLSTSVETVNLILDALSKPLNFDLRNECSQTPLFKKGLASIHDLKVGDIVTGSVNNITHFGCFVDVGVGQDGLIHQSKMSGFNLQIGDRVEVKVLNVEVDRKRISLQMINKL